jgi:hypothetical protein
MNTVNHTWRNHRGYITLLVIALIVRIAIIWYAVGYRENTDILRWKDRVRIAYLHSIADTYKTDYLQFGTLPNNMPPLGHYINYFMYQIWLQLGKLFAYFGIPPGSNNWVNGPLLTLLLRMPSLAADIGISLLLYVFVYRLTNSKRKGLLTTGLFLFNPAIVFNSAFMGQMDSLENIFFLFGVWMMLKKWYYVAAAMISCSLLVKFSLIYTIPVFLYLVLLLTKSLWSLLLSTIVAVIVTMIGILPISTSPFSWYVNFFLHNATGEMTNMTVFAFNAWWLLFRPHVTFGPNTSAFSSSEIQLLHSPPVDQQWFGVPLGILAISLFIVVSIPLVIRMMKLKRNLLKPKWLCMSLSMICLLAFLFFPKMHERYIYPVFPLLAVAIGFRAPVFREYVLLSILNTVNLFIVWHPIPLSNTLYTILSDQNFQWFICLCTVSISLLLYIRTLRMLAENA